MTLPGQLGAEGVGFRGFSLRILVGAICARKVCHFYCAIWPTLGGSHAFWPLGEIHGLWQRALYRGDL